MDLITILKKIFKRRIFKKTIKDEDKEGVKVIFNGQSEVRLVDRGKIIKRTRFI